MHKRIVTIGGLPGSGKSSTARGIAAMLDYRHFSSGDFFREIAIKRGVTVDQLMANPLKEVDDEVDELVRRKGQEEDLVIDSRTAFHWIPASFKVFLVVDSGIAAARVFAQLQQEGRKAQTGSSVDDVRQKIVERIQNERKRYQELYGFDYADRSHYDLVVDTALSPLPEVIEKIVAGYRART